MQLESDIERRVVEHAKKSGMIVEKMLDTNGMPDRIFLHKGGVFFIEFKQKGSKPRKLQVHQINKLRQAGFTVYVIDDAAIGRSIIDMRVCDGSS